MQTEEPKVDHGIQLAAFALLRVLGRVHCCLTIPQTPIISSVPGSGTVTCAIDAKVSSMPSSESSYAALKSPSHYPSSPRLSRHSNDTDDSLRDLELSEGPSLVDSPRHARGRSYSVSGFDFQHDLLPLSASVSEPDRTQAESSEKHIGLFNGEY